MCEEILIDNLVTSSFQSGAVIEKFLISTKLAIDCTIKLVKLN